MPYLRPTFSQRRQINPAGIPIFCSHRTRNLWRRLVYENLSPWEMDFDYFPLEATQQHRFGDRKNLQAALKKLIGQSWVFLVTARMSVHRSPEMWYEIETANELGIPMIPVQFSGQSVLPPRVLELCGRGAVVCGGYLKERILEVLPEERRIAFKKAQIARLIASRCAA